MCSEGTKELFENVDQSPLFQSQCSPGALKTAPATPDLTVSTLLSPARRPPPSSTCSGGQAHHPAATPCPQRGTLRASNTAFRLDGSTYLSALGDAPEPSYIPLH